MKPVRMSAAEIMRYSFDAMQSWASERGLARHVGETPLEFAERVAMEVPAMERAAPELAAMYAGLAYARRVPTAEQIDRLRGFWQLLTDLVERPMSAGAA